MKKEKAKKSTTAGEVRETTENEIITLEEFSKTLDWLRDENNYTCVESQRYFKRVHNIDKDQFEELSARLD
jgi:hypothetical protein